MIALKENIELPEDSSSEYTVLLAMFSFNNFFHDLLNEDLNKKKIDAYDSDSIIMIGKFKKLIHDFISFRKQLIKKIK